MTEMTSNQVMGLQENLASEAHDTSPPATQPMTASWLSVEHAAYIGIVLLAAALRLYNLGDPALSMLEAANAWPAWLGVNGFDVSNPPLPSSPLLLSLHTLLFWLTGGGDYTARLAPALAGIGLVLLAWPMRLWLGRGVALSLAFLLAIDPWLVAFSRLADGAMLAIFFGMLTLVCIIQIGPLDVGPLARRRWLSVAAVAVGLTLISGPVGWSFVPVLAIGGILYLRTRAIPWAEWRALLLLLTVTVALGATAWLARPQGIGVLSASLSQWLLQIAGLVHGGYPLGWSLTRLIVDQPFLVVFGPLGIVMLWRSQISIPGRSWILLLLAWLGWGLLLTLVPGRNPFNLLMLGLPLTFAAASGLTRVIERSRRGVDWGEGSVLVITLSILLISGLFWGASLLDSNQLDATAAQATITILLLVVLVVVLFALWSSWDQAWRVVGPFLAGLLLVMTLGGGWQLARTGDADRLSGLFREVAHADMRRLAADVETISAQRSGSAYDLPIRIQSTTGWQRGDPGGREGAGPDPVLGWNLRLMRDLRWVQSPAAQPGIGPAPLLVTVQEGDEALALPGLQAGFGDDGAPVWNHTGGDYALRLQWLPSDLLNQPALTTDGAGLLAWMTERWARVQPLLRWAFYRDVTQTPDVEKVILWIPVE